MPNKPKRLCGTPGCPNITDQRFCEQHRKQDRQHYDKERGTAAARGYDSRWRRYRERYLKQYPLCVKCEKEGRLVPATVVDHIDPVEGPDDPRFWDPNNHQPMCAHHHDRKRATEDKATWKGRRSLKGRGGGR